MLLSKNWFDKSPLCVAWVLVALLTSCHDDVLESVIPQQYVSYNCNIHTINAVMEQTTGQAQLESPGGYVRIWDARKLTASDAVGLGGLLLLHSFDNTAFYAFDLTCPYCFTQGGSKQDKMQRLVIKEDGFTAQCTHCSSEFGSVYWGSPVATAGPANEENLILRQYKAVLVGDILTVTR